MSIIGTATNSSPYLAAPAAAAIENGKNHFVTLGENGIPWLPRRRRCGHPAA